MAKRVLCARKRCRAELEEVPPIAVGSNIVVEMPSALAQVGTASVPTYGLRASRGALLFAPQLRYARRPQVLL